MNVDTFKKEHAEYQHARTVYWDGVHTQPKQSWSDYYRKKLWAAYAQVISPGASVLELGCGRGDLLAALEPSCGVGIDCSAVVIAQAKACHPALNFHVYDAHAFALPDGPLGHATFDYIVISDLVNDLWDVQKVLSGIKRFCAPHTRVVCNFYSHVWNLPLFLGQKLGIATPRLTQNWLTPNDMGNLLSISGFQPLRSWAEILVPIHIPFVSNFSNRYLAKLLPFRWFDLANFVIARPMANAVQPAPSVSVVVAARNESGHIDELIARIPDMGSNTELIFVEGHSTDDTYAAIERAIAANPQLHCKLIRQSGKGKGDAVRAGFDIATGDILMILDADITVPPEDLPRFYDLLQTGDGEFINGVRLVYPMEGNAMRFANLVGNKFFSWAFSWLLGQPIRDTLCGTKVLWRKDYQRIEKNRAYFGDFDPFGDFDLLFGAAKLNLKILEVPIRYRARRYGETNISRWKHGWLLLRMVAFAARRIKFV
jgi:ubiquinone/menaquinone biosynthesis C-methylase UbiE